MQLRTFMDQDRWAGGLAVRSAAALALVTLAALITQAIWAHFGGSPLYTLLAGIGSVCGTVARIERRWSSRATSSACGWCST